MRLVPIENYWIPVLSQRSLDPCINFITENETSNLTMFKEVEERVFK